MENLILLSLLSLAVLTLAGCPANDDAKTGDMKNITVETKDNSTESGNAENSEPKISPDEIDLDKPISAGDLREAVFADFAAWKGKEVLVSARYYTNTYTLTKDGKKKDVTVNLTVPEKAEGAGTMDLALKCIVKEEAAKNYKPTEFIETDGVLNIRGKIAKFEDLSQINLRTVELRDCKLMKQEEK